MESQSEELESGEIVEDQAVFFIHAGSVLDRWKWPDIPGLKGFRRKLMHSANYEEGYDLAGKKVQLQREAKLTTRRQ
jgi:cation diffusion facilitator CzcD-associated flavoprotein CzcO